MNKSERLDQTAESHNERKPSAILQFGENVSSVIAIEEARKAALTARARLAERDAAEEAIIINDALARRK